VLELLTKYLVQHRNVSIPSVGSLHVVHEPARYDVTDKRIVPPGYRIDFREYHEVGAGQVDFLSRELKMDQDSAKNEIRAFGEKLAKTIKHQPVEWSGLGAFVLEENKINFRPVEYNALNAVDAPKVIHQGAQHVIRRGETEFTSAIEQQEAVIVPRKIKATTIGWILLFAAVLFVAAWFFIHKTDPGATGLQF
jgi:nucleoid DNA-binding protein